MRKFTVMAMVMVVVMMLTTGFAGADDISIDNRNNNTNTNTANSTSNSNSNATGGNANATGGNVNLRNSFVSPIQPYNPNAPAPIQTGAALTIGEWGLFLPTFFEQVTYAQAESLADEYNGFFVADRIGNEAIMTKDLAPSASIAIAKYWGRMGNDQYVASFPIFGKKGDQLEGLLGLATKRAMELGANKVGIMIRVIKEVNTKGLSLGTGAGLSLYIPCNSSVGTGLSLGAYISNTKTEDMYELNVVCLRGGSYEPPVAKAAPPVLKPEPAPPQVCNPAGFLEIIKKADAKIATCWRYCHHNMSEQLESAKGNMDAFLCTGDKKYLVAAIGHYKMAELNHIHGFDIKKYADSDAIIAEVEYGLASAFYAQDGSIENFWKAPTMVKHIDKRTGKDKWVAATSTEKREILKLRKSLERCSTNLTLN